MNLAPGGRGVKEDGFRLATGQEKLNIAPGTEGMELYCQVPPFDKIIIDFANHLMMDSPKAALKTTEYIQLAISEFGLSNIRSAGKKNSGYCCIEKIRQGCSQNGSQPQPGDIASTARSQFAEPADLDTDRCKIREPGQSETGQHEPFR